MFNVYLYIVILYLNNTCFIKQVKIFEFTQHGSCIVNPKRVVRICKNIQRKKNDNFRCHI